MKHNNTQPLYIFNRENPQNIEPQNGPRRGLDFIALINRDRPTSVVDSPLVAADINQIPSMSGLNLKVIRPDPL